MYQRIQGKFAAQPQEELQSRNIVSPANAVTIVKFATKILLDQGPSMLDFALSSKEETCMPVSACCSSSSAEVSWQQLLGPPLENYVKREMNNSRRSILRTMTAELTLLPVC